MKSLTLLWQVTAQNLGSWCCTSTIRDFKTVSDRVKYEGLSFLTITLPSFGKDFEKSLAQGSVDRDLFKGFPFRGGAPKFLGGFLDLVFDRGTGLLVQNPNITAIFAIRQLTLMNGKLERMCSDARISVAMEGFVDCEKELKLCDSRRSEAEMFSFHRMSHLLWDSVWQKVDRDIDLFRIIPKHGPGSTADKLKGNQKFRQTEWTWRLEKVFSSADFLIPSPRLSFLDNLDRVKFLEPGAERPVRVVGVPKTMDKPRLIAIEPTCTQYVQQGISESIVKHIEHDDIMSWFVGFSDQLPNRDMARIGSQKCELATLDLSEASDRVSNQLVLEMLRWHPSASQGIQSCRSRKADVLGHGVIRLAKFASMGSALTFPLEAMVFSTVVFLGIQDVLKRPLTQGDLLSLRGQVRIYGDDIIIPIGFVHAVVERLQTFGFKVNLKKSFYTGKYRESCGGDFYDGDDVTVVRVRHDLPSRRQDAQELISAVSLRNRMYNAGLFQVTDYLDKLIGRLIPFPIVLSTSPILGRIDHSGYSVERSHPTLHTPLVRGLVVHSVIPKNSLDGEGALMKFFLKRGDLPFADRKHLEQSGRPAAVNTKLRWASPF